MISTPSSRLRRPRFDTNSDSQSLAAYTKQCHKRLRISDVSKNQNTTDSNVNATEIDNQPEGPGMDQCIALLEPHLSAFRASIDDEVPPALVRVARFFPWRWIPIQKALLRPPPPMDEVEVGRMCRLELAMACSKRGLVASSQVERLQVREEGFEDDPIERVRVALVRLPSDGKVGWDHARGALVEFRKTVSVGDSNGVVDRVVDWTLTSWTALVLSGGMDTGSSLVEKELARMLSDQRNTSATVFSRVVARRIDDMLSPATISCLSGVHLFSLGKLLSHYDSELAEEHIAKSVVSCAQAGGMIGLEPLSRLLAVYVCCVGVEWDEPDVCRREGPGDDSLYRGKQRVGIKHDIEARLVTMVAKEEEEAGVGASMLDNTRDAVSHVRSFLNLVLGAMAHLVSINMKK